MITLFIQKGFLFDVITVSPIGKYYPKPGMRQLFTIFFSAACELLYIFLINEHVQWDW